MGIHPSCPILGLAGCSDGAGTLIARRLQQENYTHSNVGLQIALGWYIVLTLYFVAASLVYFLMMYMSSVCTDTYIYIHVGEGRYYGVNLS